MKYFLFFIFTLTISAYSQFSSKIDYNKENTEDIVNEYAGITIFGNSSKSNWAVKYYDSQSSLIENQFKATISSTDLGLSAFYFKKVSANLDIFSKLTYHSLSKTSDLKIDRDTVLTYSIPNIELTSTFLENKISFLKNKYSILSKINLLNLETNNHSSDSYEASVGLSYNYEMNKKSNLVLHSNVAFYDDNYKTLIAPKIKNIYALMPQYDGGLAFHFQKGQNFFIIGYKFSLYLDKIFTKNDCSNIEISYKRKLSESFSITANLGTNFEFNSDYLTKPLPLYYYSIGIKNSFLKNRIELEFLWDYKIIKMDLAYDYYLNNSKSMTNVDFSATESDYEKNNFAIKLSYNIR